MFKASKMGRLGDQWSGLGDLSGGELVRARSGTAGHWVCNDKALGEHADGGLWADSATLKPARSRIPPIFPQVCTGRAPAQGLSHTFIELDNNPVQKGETFPPLCRGENRGTARISAFAKVAGIRSQASEHPGGGMQLGAKQSGRGRGRPQTLQQVCRGQSG